VHSIPGWKASVADDIKPVLWSVFDGNGASVAIALVNRGARHCWFKLVFLGEY
jgi:hypothetical protein